LTDTKKIKGRKRHIVTDSNGYILEVAISSANMHDSKASLDLLIAAKKKNPYLQRFLADSAYGGNLQRSCFLKTGSLLSIVKRTDKAFSVIPKRWVVERSFAWLNGFRRLSKDYEHSSLSSRTNIFISSAMLLGNFLLNSS
jgi:transposase